MLCLPGSSLNKYNKNQKVAELDLVANSDSDSARSGAEQDKIEYEERMCSPEHEMAQYIILGTSRSVRCW